MDYKHFEESVAHLLHLSGFTVQRERLVGHKKVDLYAEERRLGSSRRLAIECKCSSRVLTQEQLTRIYANYLPLYEGGLIDEILVVTLRGLAPSAETMVAETRQLYHLTLADLESMLMDFRQYLQMLVEQYSEDGLSHYYIRSLTETGQDLQELVEHWLFKGAKKPIAILASYGMGKTSFVRHFSAQLAKRALADRQELIPIVIRLGDISSEQSLEGLLGKTFTSLSIVRNYTFDVFMRLNSQGRFVIFLDGFDEMKHTLTWDQFRFNFKELNRLVTGKSRVVLLGRPTAFLSDREHLYALHGITSSGTRQLRDPDWPDYREVWVAPFTEDQIDDFLCRYVEFKLSRVEDASERKRTEVVLKRRTDDLRRNKRLLELAQRPVQLRILAEVLPQWEGSVEDITVPSLYNHFVDIVIKREQEKLGRQRFSTEERRGFASDLAFWLWVNKRQMSVTAEDIPSSMINRFSRSDSQRLEAVRRDMVSACFLERKVGGALYFPHRSFQEFLVAESIRAKLLAGTLSPAELSNATTPDVGSFLTAVLQPSDFPEIDRRLGRYHGLLGESLLLALAADGQYWVKQLLERNELKVNPWTALISALAALRGRLDSVSRTSIISRLSSGPDPKWSDQEKLLALLCMIAAANGELAKDEFSFSILLALENYFRAELEMDHESVSVASQKTRREPCKFCGFLAKLRVFQPKGHQRKGERVILLRAGYAHMRDVLKDYCYVREWETQVFRNNRATPLWFGDLPGLPDSIAATYDDGGGAPRVKDMSVLDLFRLRFGALPKHGEPII